MDRLLLALACLPYLVASGYACYFWGARHVAPSRLSLYAILGGFALQSWGLYLRGEQIGHCPVTNLYETLTFFSWALVLNYVVLGPIFRVSLLGIFTAPMVLLINLIALLTPGIDVMRKLPPYGAYLEMHISLSLLAYGTLGLSAMAGVLYLITNHLLKSRTGPNLLDRLPPIGQMEQVSWRVAFFGWLLLTLGLFFGFGLPTEKLDIVKISWSLFFWGFYLVLIVGRKMAKFGPARFCWCCVIGFSVLLLSFWGINALTESHRFHL